MHRLKVNGQVLPPLAELKISDNKIWSSNSGRSSDGKMTGTIVGIKRKFECQFIPLTPSQLATVRTAINNVNTPFFSVELTLNYMTQDSQKITFTAYAGDMEGNLGWDAMVNNKAMTRYDGISVSLIEQ